MRKTVMVNDAGLRVGEDHPKAQLTDAEVECVRQLREVEGMSYRVLAEKFEQHKGTIAKICRYERRGQLTTRIKIVSAR